jgi:hypothetical protein
MRRPQTLRFGRGPYGVPLMKFTLTYDGELPSTGNGSKKTEKKWEIRKQFHPQLEELWRLDAWLQYARKHAILPSGVEYATTECHHTEEEFDIVPPAAEKTIDLCAEIEVAGRKFYPLVRKSFALSAALKITFLRREAPGGVYLGGDLDNRIKTLLDALCVPPKEQVVSSDATMDDPIYCLLEDDSLVTGLTIETHRLLSRPNSPASEVHLLVEVDVRVVISKSYNQSFFGG